ncbi:hypothetical protein [Streptomyces sp. NPDC101206]|uniref:hypothetical protein n=1 Tax=Streptomyces sp. NPDC101206 TaxID=3366128 RepID=UPI00382D767A
MVEVNRPDKAERRRIGKSDPIDAYAAARRIERGTRRDDHLAGAYRDWLAAA